MKVGCIKEIKKFEFRVGLTPDNVKTYVANGNIVYIEKGAGEGSGFSDEDYKKSGAIIKNKEYIWQEADMIVKVKEPLAKEYEWIRDHQIIYTYLHLAADEALKDVMLKKKVTGVAYETLSLNGRLPLLKPMSEIAGRLAIQEGARFLLKQNGGRGILISGVSGVQGAKILILGAGIVGKNATKIAVGMSGEVTVMDTNVDRLTYLDDLYASRIKTIYSSPENIEREIKDADLVISSVLIPGASSPKVITRKHLKTMKPGAVIIDPAIDQGGSCEVSRPTYHDAPVFVEEGVILYCVSNMPGAVPYTSTLALTNVSLQYGNAIATYGLEKSIQLFPEIASAVNTYDGNITHEAVANSFSMPYTPLQFN